MSEPDSDFLQLSGLQHFVFCRRQWALIHIENQWAENLRTVEGNILHQRAHDETVREVRGDCITVRGVDIHSPTMEVSGKCDVLEFRRSKTGVPLDGQTGLWQPYPVEYKRGEPKRMDADRLQLCCQAMCLEEMLCCDIPEGALFYGQTRRREQLEGAGATAYFGVFDQMILQNKDAFFFHGRNRRPPLDNVNAMLSFAYSLLSNDCASAL